MRHVRTMTSRLMKGAIIVTMLMLAAWLFGKPAVAAPDGLERARELAQAWARHVSESGRGLDPSGDMALGETGLAYDRSRDVLVGRVYVNMALVKGVTPSELAILRRMVMALNDPAIGGMYDHGGGRFVLDEPREAYYLTRSFSVPATTARSLIRDMDRMREVAPTWTVKWLLDVAMIMHGKEKPPTLRQTIPR